MGDGRLIGCNPCRKPLPGCCPQLAGSQLLNTPLLREVGSDSTAAQWIQVNSQLGTITATKRTERQTTAWSDSTFLIEFLTANRMASGLQTKVVQINRVAIETLAGWWQARSGRSVCQYRSTANQAPNLTCPSLQHRCNRSVPISPRHHDGSL